MSFKDSVAADIGVFLNVEEFAETMDVVYEGVLYSIPVVLEKNQTEDRKHNQTDFMQGVFPVTKVAYLAETDIGVIPKQGSFISIDDYEYRIATSDVEMGVIRLGLEAYDE